MAEPPVVNTSPLIILTRAGLLNALRLLADTILVPTAVVTEVDVRGPNDPTVRAIAETDWLIPVDTPVVPPGLRAHGLGAGETAALAWALAHPGTTAILDDHEARRAAVALGVPIVGTLGIIVAAKESGMIAQAAPIIERAQRAGLYLSDRLIRDALRRVGE